MPHATFPLATVDSTCGIGMVACFDRSVLVEDSSQGLAGLLSFEIFALTNHIVLLYPKSSSLDETFDECLDSDQCNDIVDIRLATLFWLLLQRESFRLSLAHLLVFSVLYDWLVLPRST